MSMPTTVIERGLIAEGAALVAGVDEVGRGAWAGPLSVGVALVGARELRLLPRGVRDSKLLSPVAREALFEPLRRAVHSYAIGHVSPEECDELGLTAAQRLGAERARGALGVVPDAVIVDGLIDFVGAARSVVRAHADRTSRIVAAASVLAKVTRDRLMIACSPDYPPYRFEKNKGYASSEHRRAVARHGMTKLHRASWSVSLEDGDDAEAADDGGAGIGPTGGQP